MNQDRPRLCSNNSLLVWPISYTCWQGALLLALTRGPRLRAASPWNAHPVTAAVRRTHGRLHMGFEHVCPRERHDSSTLIALAKAGHIVRTNAKMCSCTLDRKERSWRGDSPTNDHTCPYVSQTQLHSESCPQENSVVDTHHTLLSSLQQVVMEKSKLDFQTTAPVLTNWHQYCDWYMYDVLPDAGQWLINLLEQRTELSCSLNGGK